jgi:hypothetical protein
MGALPNYADNATQEQAGRHAVHDLALKSEKACTLSFASFLYFGSPTWTRTRDLRINRNPGGSKSQYIQWFISKKTFCVINCAIEKVLSK